MDSQGWHFEPQLSEVIITAYKPNIPTGLVNLDTDYQNIQNNFSQLDTTYGVNHVKYSTVPNNGKHTYVEMINQPSIPVGLTANEGTVYTKLVSARSEEFYTPDNTGNEYQMTATDTANFGTFALANGWTFLPGGLIMQYGSGNFPGSSSAPIVFPKAFTTAPYVVTYGIEGTVELWSNILPGSVTTTGFTLRQSDSTSRKYYWQAIGK